MELHSSNRSSPLTFIFDTTKSTLSTAGARLARYATLLGSHDYNIECKNTAKHSNIKRISTLPLSKSGSEPKDPVDAIEVAQLLKTCD